MKYEGKEEIIQGRPRPSQCNEPFVVDNTSSYCVKTAEPVRPKVTFNIRAWEANFYLVDTDSIYTQWSQWFLKLCMASPKVTALDNFFTGQFQTIIM